MQRRNVAIGKCFACKPKHSLYNDSEDDDDGKETDDCEETDESEEIVKNQETYKSKNSKTDKSENRKTNKNENKKKDKKTNIKDKDSKIQEEISRMKKLHQTIDEKNDEEDKKRISKTTDVEKKKKRKTYIEKDYYSDDTLSENESNSDIESKVSNTFKESKASRNKILIEKRIEKKKKYNLEMEEYCKKRNNKKTKYFFDED